MTTTGTGNGESTPANEENTEQVREPGQETKLVYDSFTPCEGCGRHGIAHFADGKQEAVNTFDDIERLCRMMDDESAQYFRDDVNNLQVIGYLGELLSPAELQEKRNVRQERRKVEGLELEERLKDLQEENLRVEMAGSSNHSLARTVTDYLMIALDEEKLNKVYSEMGNRNMVITIGVVAGVDTDNPNLNEGRNVLNLIINPEDLFKPDVKAEKDNVRAETEALIEETAAFMKNNR